MQGHQRRCAVPDVLVPAPGDLLTGRAGSQQRQDYTSVGQSLRYQNLNSSLLYVDQQPCLHRACIWALEKDQDQEQKQEKKQDHDRKHQQEQDQHEILEQEPEQEEE